MIRLRYVGDGHYISCGIDTNFGTLPPPSLPINAKRFWRYWRLAMADNAILARCDKELVGFFRYSVDEKVLHAGGTWVAPKFRRQGLASRMWKLVLAKHGIREVSVWPVSTGGRRLVKSLLDKGLFNEY